MANGDYSNLITESDAVWYDDAHSSGHVHRTGITMKNDGACHIDANVVINNSVIFLGNTSFNGPVTAASGPAAFTSLESLTVESTYAYLNRMYLNMHNDYGAGCLMRVANPAEYTHSTGGNTLVLHHAEYGTYTDAITVVPDNFSIPVAYQHLGYTGVALSPGQMVFLMWVSDGYRVIQTTGTYVV